MKRTITSMLGALVVATGFLVAPAYAQSTVVCTTVPSGAQLPVVANPLPTTQPARNQELSKINDWPRVAVKDSTPPISHLYYCINGGNPSTDTKFSAMWQAAQNIGTTGTNTPPQYVANQFYQTKQRV
jgi:hypothetical protein